MKYVDGEAFVNFPGNVSEMAIRARSLALLGQDHIGCEVALLFEDGDITRPLIVGRIVKALEALTPPIVIRDGKQVSITAAERIELRVGESSIIMEKDGHITIRGKHLVSHASDANRLRGGSISLN